MRARRDTDTAYILATRLVPPTHILSDRMENSYLWLSATCVYLPASLWCHPVKHAVVVILQRKQSGVSSSYIINMM